jgi:secreted Zn-dependent insulinase-like peptidase
MSLELTGKGDDSKNVNATLSLPAKQDYAYIQLLTSPEEKNKAVEYYIQVRPKTGKFTFTQIQARILLLAHLIYPHAFKTLRADEKLGYLAFTTSWIQATAVGLVIQIQGEKEPSLVVSFIDKFLKDYRETLVDMPKGQDHKKGQFEEQRDALVEKLSQVSINLDAKAVHLAHPYLTGSDPDQRKISCHSF